MVGPARRLLSLECVQNLNTFCVIGCVILTWCHGRVKYFWTPKFAWTHCHDKKFYLTTSLPVALWRLLAGTVMVEGHGIESCHGTAERSQEKVMVLLSASDRLYQCSHLVRPLQISQGPIEFGLSLFVRLKIVRGREKKKYKLIVPICLSIRGLWGAHWQQTERFHCKSNYAQHDWKHGRRPRSEVAAAAPRNVQSSSSSPTSKAAKQSKTIITLRQQVTRNHASIQTVSQAGRRQSLLSEGATQDTLQRKRMTSSCPRNPQNESDFRRQRQGNSWALRVRLMRVGPLSRNQVGTGWQC